MANRVLLGHRGGEYGIWVSRPGWDVVGAPDDQMLLSTSRRSAQVIASGALSVSPASSYPISWPYNLGFSPMLLVGSARLSVTYVHTSMTTATLQTGQDENFGFWTTSNRPNPAYIVRWVAINVPG